MRVDLVAVGALLIALGSGMIYVTWINPSSSLKPILCARWYLLGRAASRFGAVAQALTLWSLGLLAILSGLQVSCARWAFLLLGVGVLAMGIARLGDLRDDEI